MKSVPFQEAQRWANDYDSHLNASDPRFDHGLIITTDDGFHITATDAFLVIHKILDSNWLFAFFEHREPFMCDLGEVLYMKQFKERIPVEVV